MKQSTACLFIIFSIIVLSAPVVNAQTTDTATTPTVTTQPSKTPRETMVKQKEIIMEKRAAVKEAVQEKRADIKETIRLKREETKAAREVKREEFKVRLQTIKDEKKQALTERIDAKMETANQKATDKMATSLQRMQEVLTKIQTQATSLKASGVNTASLDLAMLNAQADIDSAETAVAAQAAKSYTAQITTEATLRRTVGAAVSQLRNDLQATHKTVIEAKQSLQEAVRELGKLRGEKKVTEATPSSTLQ